MLEQASYTFKYGPSEELLLNVPAGVFVPTGTSQSLVKAVKGYVKSPGKTVDLGCGCGAVGIALHKLGLIEGSLYASDLSEKAVESVNLNAKKYNCPVEARAGSLFEPWSDEKFDCIVDDISGVSEEAAKISPWFNNVPCVAGADGTFLIVQVIQQAAKYLNHGGRLFFPIISFSDVDKIVKVANDHFSHVERLAHDVWPLPKEMSEHLGALKALQQRGYVQFTEKFGLVLCFTDIYVAYNS
ncbi:MAG: methyltransferase [bacterium]